VSGGNDETPRRHGTGGFEDHAGGSGATTVARDARREDERSASTRTILTRLVVLVHLLLEDDAVRVAHDARRFRKVSMSAKNAMFRDKRRDAR